MKSIEKTPPAAVAVAVLVEHMNQNMPFIFTNITNYEETFTR